MKQNQQNDKSTPRDNYIKTIPSLISENNRIESFALF